jgi:hypothetical protein
MMRWMRSNPNDPDFIFEWHGEVAHFTTHVKAAMGFSKLDLEGGARKYASYGWDEVVPGKWVEDEEIILAGHGDADRETLMLLYGQPDIYKRIAGRRIPYTVRKPPPAQLVNKMLAAHFPRVYGERSTVNVNTNGPSVLVVGNRPQALPAPVDVTPRQMIEQAPPVKLDDVAEDVAEIDETQPVVSAETLPPDFEADSEDSGPPVKNAEPPQPPRHEPEPPEFTTPRKEGEKPEVVQAEPTVSEKAAAARARLEAQARDLQSRIKAGKQSGPTLPINTGVNLLSPISPTKEL